MSSSSKSDSKKSSSVQPTAGSVNQPAGRERRQIAREIGQKRTKIQAEAYKNIPENSLFIILFLRSDPPAANDFHWGYYFHKNADVGGFKYHLTNKLNKDYWMPDHDKTTGVLKSNFLCVLIKIASIAPGRDQKLDEKMRSKDDTANQIAGVTCRVWLLTILSELVAADLVRCKDIKALEAECFELGNRHMASASKAEQPRPIELSRVCEL